MLNFSGVFVLSGISKLYLRFFWTSHEQAQVLFEHGEARTGREPLASPGSRKSQLTGRRNSRTALKNRTARKAQKQRGTDK